MNIRSRAPLRLGLAGGGTDVAPYCDLYGGYVLNATIDRYAYAVIKTLNEPLIRFVTTDQQIETTTILYEPLELNGTLDIHKAAYNHMIQHYNDGKPISLELTTFCDAPVGSGLGASSTLAVAIIGAFVELLNLPLDDYTVARIAFEIERIDCGFLGGKQDQYSATFGGFNFMEFNPDGHVIVNSLRIKSSIICELEASLVLFFTGVSRESSKIIADQSNNMKIGCEKALEAMHGLKQEALMMKAALLRGNFDALIESMQLGWESKKRSAKTVSNSFIDDIYRLALNAGALAGKISGAGGGGFMLFFVPPERRMDLIQSLSQFKGQVSNCHFTKHGTQAWRV